MSKTKEVYSAVIRRESLLINQIERILRGTKYISEYWQLYYYPHDNIALRSAIDTEEDLEWKL